MSSMRRACKHTHRCYKYAVPKSENKIISILKNKNIKIFSLSVVCVFCLGIAFVLYFNGQTEFSDDLIGSCNNVSTNEIISCDTTDMPTETTTFTAITEPEKSSVESNTTTISTTIPITTSESFTSNYTPSSHINENTSPENIIYSENGFTIDVSNSNQGYVGVKQSYENNNSKVKIMKDDEIYYYDLLSQNNYEFLPLQMGSGNYEISFLKNISGNRYMTAFSEDLNINLSSEFMPFLYPNQYVNYNSDSYCALKSIEICRESKSELESLQLVYNYILNNLSFDYSRLNNSDENYIPDIDYILETGRATCFDYATSLTAMLRVQGIPSKLIIGTTEPKGLNHAWVKVYMNNEGYLAENLYMSQGWNIVDPTFASSGEYNIEEYISNSSNYNGQRIY